MLFQFVAGDMMISYLGGLMIKDLTQIQSVPENEHISAKPLLKWAGGKGQLLSELLPLVPHDFSGSYIEPFFGGGALFFALQPSRAILADCNPELINLYQQVADYPEAVLDVLATLKNSERDYYSTRALDWTKLSPVDAAARTIYLNKTCYNGLYRVNRQGQFNTPYGRYLNPKIADRETILAASNALKQATIVAGNYKTVLHNFAKSGDFVFLDPPYLPISQYSDFKRYTKEQFYEEDHRELAKEVRRLVQIGCHVVLTNSTHPLVLDLYSSYHIKIVATRRYINCDARRRTGEDVIVIAEPK